MQVIASMEPPDSTSRRRAVLLILVLGMLAVSAVSGQASASSAAEPGQDSGVVYLTFDDGPHPMYTPMILDLLERRGAQATFFPLGRRLEERWETHQIQDLLNRGHALGNHSWNHPRLLEMTRVDMRHELDQASAVVEKRAGYRPRCFRAPYGEVDATVLEVGNSMGMGHVAWDADPQEWRSPTVEEALGHIRARLHDGSVVLMHDRRWMTLPILAKLLQVLPADRWSFQALPECGPGGDPLARMVSRNIDSLPVGSIWEAVRQENTIRVTGWAYHPASPTGGLIVTVNANGQAPEVLGVTGRDHSFSVIVGAPVGLVPVCVWIGESGRTGHEAFLGCLQPVPAPQN